MIYILYTGSTDSYIISVHSSLDEAQKAGDLIISQAGGYLYIESWELDTDHYIDFWDKMESSYPQYKDIVHDWKLYIK
jgi:hypothetical protein